MLLLNTVMSFASALCCLNREIFIEPDNDLDCHTFVPQLIMIYHLLVFRVS